MNFCGKCGNRLREGDSFCGECGRKRSDYETDESKGSGGKTESSAYNNVNNNNNNSYYNQNIGMGYNNYSNTNTANEKSTYNMTLFDGFVRCMKHYADFNGRARRKELWGFVLFLWLFYMCGSIIGAIIDGIIGVPFFTAIICISSLGFIVPGIAVAVRRLHDIGKSGYWYFISLIPFVGGIVMLVFFLTDGTNGPNMYGLSQKSKVSGIW